MAATAVIPDSDTLVTVQNVSERTFSVYCGPDRPAFTLEPGQRRRIPVAWCRTFFGDERSIDVYHQVVVDGDKVLIHPRPVEVTRLQRLYGAEAYPGRFVLDHTDCDILNCNHVVTRPEVVVTTLDGERVTTVLDDPEGTSVIEAHSTVDETLDLKEELMRLQRRILLLEGLRAQGVEELAPPLLEADLPRDKPARGKP